jgi:hypothetical protein
VSGGDDGAVPWVFLAHSQSLCLARAVAVSCSSSVSIACSWGLFLGYNSEVGTEGWQALGAALPLLRNLKVLELGEKREGRPVS